ncbi:MAG: chemotaxis protein CheB [bacterium]|nr:chemotaxis protein CheB [Gammaproteobacteria bacterium]HIL95276.1 chemotaxis protein CheB [Pseudomonadales bacterium]
MKRFKAVVIGTSAGGIGALSRLLAYLPDAFSFSVIIVLHVSPESRGRQVEYFDFKFDCSLHNAEDKEPIRPGCVYFAPPNYHLLIESDTTFSLSVDEKVQYSRPSIDVLFESAAHVWGHDLAGIVLTGSNADGAYGLQVVKEHGGLAVVEDPAKSEFPTMPQASLSAGEVDYILSLDQIGKLLAEGGTHE